MASLSELVRVVVKISNDEDLRERERNDFCFIHLTFNHYGELQTFIGAYESYTYTLLQPY